jgi:hypothetical protein
VSTVHEIRAALRAHGPMTCSELATHCPACENDQQIVAQLIGVLRSQGKVKGNGLSAGAVIYELADWPTDEEPTLRVAGSALDRSHRAPGGAVTSSPHPPSASAHSAGAFNHVPPKPIQEENMTTTADRIVAALDKPLPRSEFLRFTKKGEDLLEILEGLIAEEKIRRIGAGRGTKYERINGHDRREAPPAQRPAAPAQAPGKARQIAGIEIEAGIALPPAKGASPLMQALQALEVGESFLHSTDAKDQRRRECLEGREFTSRAQAAGGYRIWRTK